MANAPTDWDWEGNLVGIDAYVIHEGGTVEQS
jgi:hypothetical protein